ncbi:hypothetical protein J2853_003893 [Streptosporangium lutulentum]|uniref:Uncharacterized protein n=1 Tax=Streptosporangium lutulentum TaxID=1461250 RepID=A0ABT9QD39_9ACTN|nr:hypothetical protein [Streptosporangium lutulentum]
MTCLYEGREFAGPLGDDGRGPRATFLPAVIR